LDTLRAAIDRVTQAGALACAPRELALARAHYDFAQLELQNGEAARAQRHIGMAEQNLGAAQVLTPDRGCATSAQGAVDEIPTIPRSSMRLRSGASRVVNTRSAEADGGNTFPAGAVKNTDARCLITTMCRNTDNAHAAHASQIAHSEWSRSSFDLSTERSKPELSIRVSEGA
jgi:hypothetical protein